MRQYVLSEIVCLLYILLSFLEHLSTFKRSRSFFYSLVRLRSDRLITENVLWHYYTIMCSQLLRVDFGIQRLYILPQALREVSLRIS